MNEHAIFYLNAAREVMTQHPYKKASIAFEDAVREVTTPCRAIGIARIALRHCHWNIDDAIRELST